MVVTFPFAVMERDELVARLQERLVGLEHELARARYLVDKVRRDARRRRAFRSPPGSTDVAWLLATEFDGDSER